MNMEQDQLRTKWQSIWAENNVFATDNLSEKPSYYVLDMFPYPSGNGLHVGHAVGYIGTDIVARKKRMEGFNVLHPMGWDAFGLPAEQYAIKTGVHPAEITKRNCENFKRQLKLMGLSYDWDREINTSDKKYYKWTQFLFLKLYERGLVYEKEENVWWCEELKTVLANEEVIDGRSERGDYPCIRKPLKQWVMRITNYADRLLDGLDKLDWPESVKKMQREWIGRTEGIDIDFSVLGEPEKVITVFSAEPETIYGINAIMLSSEHPYVKSIWLSLDSKIQVKISKMQGAEFSLDGLFLEHYVLHPMTGKEIPIYVANYLSADGKDAAAISVPDDDKKALEFSQLMKVGYTSVFESSKSGTKLINSDLLNELSRAEARERITHYLLQNNVGVRRVRYRMRDWLFSRQRYWGEPFPLYRNNDAQIIAAAYSELPIALPVVGNYSPGSDGASPLQRAEGWVTCEDAMGNPLYRVTDTMPGWAGSCWYYLRFMDPHNQTQPFSTHSTEYWNQVDLYVGGAAHATMHLLYARFWHKVLFDVGLVSFDEPFKRLFNQGIVTADAFKDATGRVVAVDEAELREGKYWLKNTNEELQVYNTKMSKSLLNVVMPDNLIQEYGVDTFRVYMMFMGPLGQNKKWDINGIKGCARFLNRVMNIFSDRKRPPAHLTGQSDLLYGVLDEVWERTLLKVDVSFITLNFNTAIAAFMEFINEAEKNKELFIERIGVDFVKALYPFAPHICSEIWERLGRTNIDYSEWPKVNVNATKVIKIYINGKYIDDLVGGTGEEQVDVDRARFKVNDALKNRSITKVIYSPKQVINFLCGNDV